MIKKAGVLLLSAMLVLAGVTGCSTKKKKIVVSVIYTEQLKNLETLVEETYDDIDLQWEFIVTASPITELRRRIDNGHSPDLIITEQPADKENAKNLAVLGGYDFSTRYESTQIQSLFVDDKLYNLPLPGHYSGYVINKTFFDRARLSIPKTNEEFVYDLNIIKSIGLGISDSGYVFDMRSKGDIVLGNFLVSCMVPDFLGTSAGVDWLEQFNKKKAALTGTWESGFHLLEMLQSNDLINLTTFTKQGNAPDNSLNMGQGKLIAAYGNSAFLKESQKRNAEAVKEGNAEPYEYMMIPILGNETENSWAISVPSGYIGISSTLSEKGNEDKLDACQRILDLISTQEGQDALIRDTNQEISYLKEHVRNASVPKGLEQSVKEGYVYHIKFSGKTVELLGQEITKYLGGHQTIADSLKNVDDYYLHDSVKIQADANVIGSIKNDMIYKNFNTRLQETTLGNLVADSVAKTAGTDIAVINGGAIRTSLYEGDVKESDLQMLLPFDNQIIVVEMSGDTMYKMLENGLSKIKTDTGVPGGRFLQVSGIHYTFDSSKPEGSRLKSVTLADGTRVQKKKRYKVAINNYMAGSIGYKEGNGDGYTMLNIFSDDVEKASDVTLIKENLGTYHDALLSYFKKKKHRMVDVTLEKRIVDVVKNET